MLEKDPRALQLLNWLLASSPWDGMTGRTCGPPQWPRGRAYSETRADLVGYANIFRSEYACLGTPKRKFAKRTEPAPPARRKRK